MSLAVIAGYGELPVIMSNNLGDRKFIVLDLESGRDARCFDKCSKYYAIDCFDISGIINILIKESVKSCLLLGKVDKSILYKNRVDLGQDSTKILKDIDNWQDSTIMMTIVSILKKLNIQVEKQTDFLYSLLAEDIVYSKRTPTDNELKDIKWGYYVAKELSKMQIGQTVVVKNGVTVAVEAIEGTDEAIKRGGTLGGENCVVVKVARTNHDERFDVPTVGMDTLETMLKYNCTALAIEANSTFIIKRDEMVKFANKNNILFIGYKEA
jgi:hypothetical protein